DPLRTRIGTVVRVHPNAFGQEVADVDLDGAIEPDLAISPVLGRVEVGEVVQVARWFPGATASLIVARAAAAFGPWRDATVPVE
ncbi:MAG TPA: hypothetical protein VEI97_12465, partial [bacterium]|nr:hypothetical protein [bacterium]